MYYTIGIVQVNLRCLSPKLLIHLASCVAVHGKQVGVCRRLSRTCISDRIAAGPDMLPQMSRILFAHFRFEIAENALIIQSGK